MRYGFQYLPTSLLLIILGLSPHYLLLTNFSPFESKRVLEILLLFLVMLGITLNVLPLHRSGKTVWLVGIGLTSLAICSALLATSPRYAFLEVASFAGLTGLALCLTNIGHLQFRKLVVVITNVTFVGAVLYMLGFYTGYLASFLEQIPLVWPEPFYMLPNVRQFNQYQLWTLGLVCLPLLMPHSAKSCYRSWCWIGIVAWWVLLYASGSRGVLLAWLGALMLTGWIYRRLAWPMLRVQVISALLGFLSYQLLFIVLPRLNAGGGGVVQTVLRTETNDRLYLWQHAWAMIEAHPWLGVGPMHFAWYPNNVAAHPHNSILQLACEFGLPATLLLLGLLGYAIRCWLKRFNPVNLNKAELFERELAISLFFTLAACAAYSLVDGVIVMPLSQVMMAVVCGLMLGLYHQDNPPAPVSIGTRLFAAVTLVTLVWAVLPELLPRLMGSYELIPTGYQVLGPRFWQEGGIPHQEY